MFDQITIQQEKRN